MCDTPQTAIVEEQTQLDSFFARLDAHVTLANRRLHEVTLNLDPSSPKAEALVQRETEYHALNEQLDRLAFAELGLVFGRIDVADSGDNPVPGFPGLDRRYIGRMGLDAKEDNYRTLIVDWRAPMARPFYTATTARPEGVVVRRHIRTSGRTVRAVHDEQLSETRENTDCPASESQHMVSEAQAHVAGEAALLHAMQRARSGRMRSIVETIQREQDQIIRDPWRGVLVVEGGPGTGKTAVALHRVAYLLYTWRKQLSRTGVLIVGPNSTFLDYISAVLPELGETGVVLSTVAGLYPGLNPTGIENDLTREVKGSAEMAHILAEDIKNYQTVPDTDLYLKVGSVEIPLRMAEIKRSRTRARLSRKPHNLARAVFREQILDYLARSYAHVIGDDPLGGGSLLSRADVDQLHDDLAIEPAVATLLNELWPILRPEEVLHNLLTSPQRIDSAAWEYDDETRSALFRTADAPWAASDAALLDELAELIGPCPTGEKTESPTSEEIDQRVKDAQETLDILAGSAFTDNDDDFDAEYLSAYDVIDAHSLAARQEVRDQRSTAQRAREDREWAYGHVVVDEAQELTPMEWRMLFRRSPNRWITLVGDTSQTGAPAGVDDWNETLYPFVGHRLRRHTLTVNYRTPQTVMDIADTVDPAERTSLSITEGRPVKWLPSDADPKTVATELKREDPERSVVIIGSEEGCRCVAEVKGLEYDHVVLVHPDTILQHGSQGRHDLYVALTRCTQSLTIIGGSPALNTET